MNENKPAYVVIHCIAADSRKAIFMANMLQNLIELHGIADAFPDDSKAFQQLQLQEILSLPEEKPDMEQLVSVYVTVEITKNTVIETPQGISFEGQILTGRKLLIEGFLHQKMEYIAEDEVQSVHAAHFTVPYSSYIILGEPDNCASEYLVTGYIEDIYVKQVGKRDIFKNVMLLLNALSRT